MILQFTFAALSFLGVEISGSTFLSPQVLAASTKEAKPVSGKPSKKNETNTSDTGDANFSYIQGRQRFLEGKYSEALPLLETALKSDPENSFILAQLSEIYLRLNDFEKAESYGQQAVDKDDKNIEYRASLGGVLAAARKYREAKAQYKKILELEPKNLKAHLLLGILEAESGDNDAAIETLSKVIEENPEGYLALFYRARIYLEGDDIDKAKSDLEKCLQLKPNFVEAGTALGLLFEKLGKNEEAIAAYSKIQGSGRFKKRLAQLYVQKNDFEKALAELVEYERVEPDDYTARVKLGLILLELKRSEEAIQKFQSILKEQPAADNVRFYLGAAFEEQKKPELAVTEYKKVSKDSSFFKESMIHVAFLYRDMGKAEQGLKFAQKLNSAIPNVPEFYDLHASFLEQKKDYKRALNTVTAGLKQFPNEERLLYFQGALLEKLGERSRAIEIMRGILAKNGNNAHALNFLGYTFAEQGENLEEAERLVRKAIELRPKDGFIVDSLGWVLFRQGKLDESLKELESAAQLQPGEPVILDHLGDVQAAKKNTVKALDYYRQALLAAEKKDKDMAKKIQNKVVGLTNQSSSNRIPTEKSND